MKLVIPFPEDLPRQKDGDTVTVQVSSQVQVDVGPLCPLPYDLKSWGERVVLGSLSSQRLRPGQRTSELTEGGWPLTLVTSDVLAEEGKKKVEQRRIHAIYCFTQYGAVATASGPPRAVAAVEARLCQLFRKGRPDFRTEEIISLSQFYDGFPIPEGATMPPRPRGSALSAALGQWSRWVSADGFLLIPPEGIAGGSIQVWERIRPLRPLRVILDEIIGGIPALERLKVGHLHRLVTGEGEFAGLISLACSTNDKPAEFHIGVIAGDDHYALIVGTARQKELAEPVRHMVHYMTRQFYLGLGEKRRRMYLYRPPQGWQGIARTGTTRYYHPDYPRHPAVITVWESRPVHSGSQRVNDHVPLLNLGGTEAEEPLMVVTKRGLRGRIVKMLGRHGQRPVAYAQVTLLDERFTYVLQLETTPDRFEGHYRTLLLTANSVKPLPSPSTDVEDGEP